MSYNSITKETLTALILIEIRKKHIELASKELLISNIIPREYIDKLLIADKINNKLSNLNSFTDDERIQKIIQLLQKHCSASTACLINDLSNS
jgi:hypothetical protein